MLDVRQRVAQANGFDESVRRASRLDAQWPGDGRAQGRRTQKPDDQEGRMGRSHEGGGEIQDGGQGIQSWNPKPAEIQSSA